MLADGVQSQTHRKPEYWRRYRLASTVIPEFLYRGDVGCFAPSLEDLVENV